MTQRLQIRPFERIVSDCRWSGHIEDGAYVWNVNARTYRIRTAAIGADERGEFAWLEPYQEPIEGGTRLCVAAEEDCGQLCCRLSVQRLNDIYIDPAVALVKQGIDPASVHVLAPPPMMTEVSILFLEGGTPTEWIGPPRVVPDGPPVVH